MRNSFFLYLAFALILLLGALNFVAGVFYFYWTVWWFDYLMHFLAGLGGGLVIVWLFSNSNLKFLQLLFLVLVILFTVGIIWEIFEYTNDIAPMAGENYILDTFSDLVMDLLGAAFAVYLGVKKLSDERK